MFTLERLQPLVPSHMLCEIVLLTKPFPTNGTKKGFLPRVSPHVFGQCGQHSEGLVADGALVFLRQLVTFHMVIQTVLSGETFITFVACES